MLAELLKRIEARDPNALKVLEDWVREQGLPDYSVAALVHSLSFGTLPESMDVFAKQVPQLKRVPDSRGIGQLFPHRYVRSFAFFDTVRVDDPLPRGLRYEFFRDLMDKPDELTNCRSPRRLPAGDDFLIKRVSVPQFPPPGTVLVCINRRTLLELPTDELARFGPMGYPVDYPVRDNDDINVRYTTVLEPEAFPSVYQRDFRITLHGWLAEPLD